MTAKAACQCDAVVAAGGAATPVTRTALVAVGVAARAIRRCRDKDRVDAATAAAGMAGARRWTVPDEAVRPPPRFGAPDKDSVHGAAAAAPARVAAGAPDPSCN